MNRLSAQRRIFELSKEIGSEQGNTRNTRDKDQNIDVQNGGLSTRKDSVSRSKPIRVSK